MLITAPNRPAIKSVLEDVIFQLLEEVQELIITKYPKPTKQLGFVFDEWTGRWESPFDREGEPSDDVEWEHFNLFWVQQEHIRSLLNK